MEAYHRAYQAGALPERVGLWAGEVYAVPPLGKKHRLYIMHLDRVFQEAFGDEGVVMVRCPLALPPGSEPVPDLVQDRTPKPPLYQQAGLPEVWIVNLLERHAKGEKVAPKAFPTRALKGWA